MDKHPIENIMTTTMENIRDIVDVDTVIGAPVTTKDGSTVIPISRVSFGFVSAGGEYSAPPCGKNAPVTDGDRMPFAGGTGAGVTIQPVGFLVTNESSVRLLPAQPYAPADRVIELMPQLMCEVKNYLSSRCKKDGPPAATEPMPVPAPEKPE